MEPKQIMDIRNKLPFYRGLCLLLGLVESAIAANVVDNHDLDDLHPTMALHNSDNRLDNHWYFGPTLETRYTHTRLNLFNVVGTAATFEWMGGAIFGVISTYNHWQAHWYIHGAAGTGRINLRANDYNIDQHTNLEHYFATSTLSLGYEFIQGRFHITPGVYTTANYSKYRTTEPMMLALINTSGTNQDDLYLHAGVLQSSAFHFNHYFSISSRTELGYIYYNNTQVDFYQANGLGTLSQSTTNHGGLYSLLGVGFNFDSSYGRFIIAPWASYIYVPAKNNSINSNVSAVGLKLLYLI